MDRKRPDANNVGLDKTGADEQSQQGLQCLPSREQYFIRSLGDKIIPKWIEAPWSSGLERLGYGAESRRKT